MKKMLFFLYALFSGFCFFSNFPRVNRANRSVSQIRTSSRLNQVKGKRRSKSMPALMRSRSSDTELNSPTSPAGRMGYATPAAPFIKEKPIEEVVAGWQADRLHCANLEGYEAAKAVDREAIITFLYWCGKELLLSKLKNSQVLVTSHDIDEKVKSVVQHNRNQWNAMAENKKKSAIIAAITSGALSCRAKELFVAVEEERKEGFWGKLKSFVKKKSRTAREHIKELAEREQVHPEELQMASRAEYADKVYECCIRLLEKSGDKDVFFTMLFPSDEKITVLSISPKKESDRTALLYATAVRNAWKYFKKCTGLKVSLKVIATNVSTVSWKKAAYVGGTIIGAVGAAWLMNKYADSHGHDARSWLRSPQKLIEKIKSGAKRVGAKIKKKVGEKWNSLTDPIATWREKRVAKKQNALTEEADRGAFRRNELYQVEEEKASAINRKSQELDEAVKMNDAGKIPDDIAILKHRDDLWRRGEAGEALVIDSDKEGKHWINQRNAYKKNPEKVIETLNKEWDADRENAYVKEKQAEREKSKQFMDNNQAYALEKSSYGVPHEYYEGNPLKEAENNNARLQGNNVAVNHDESVEANNASYLAATAPSYYEGKKPYVGAIDYGDYEEKPVAVKENNHEKEKNVESFMMPLHNDTLEDNNPAYESVVRHDAVNFDDEALAMHRDKVKKNMAESVRKEIQKKGMASSPELEEKLRQERYNDPKEIEKRIHGDDVFMAQWEKSKDDAERAMEKEARLEARKARDAGKKK